MRGEGGGEAMGSGQEAMGKKEKEERWVPCLWRLGCDESAGFVFDGLNNGSDRLPEGDARLLIRQIQTPGRLVVVLVDGRVLGIG